MAQRAFISIRMSPPTPPTSRIHPAAHVAPDALIGPGCRVGPGAVVPPGCMLAGDVSVGPNVVFVEPDVANGQRPARVDAGVRIGANAVVHPDIVLATGIVVAFPQRDVHLDTSQPLEIRMLRGERAASVRPDPATS